MRRRVVPTDDDTPTSSGTSTPDSKATPTNKKPYIRAKLHFDNEHGSVKLNAPGTPFNDIDLSETFLAHDHESRPASFFYRKRIIFILGGLLGALLALFLGRGSALSDLETHLQKLNVDFPSFPDVADLVGIRDISRALNISELIEPSRQWLSNRDFQVGRDAKARGLEKKHAIILVPGIISSGLESWSTAQDQMHLFRKRLWGTTTMIRQVVVGRREWLKAMSLDPETGLDPPDVKIRSAQGLDAASYFITGYWIWSKIIENLAVLGYDHIDMSLAAYDWRLSFGNLQVRDHYFSRLQYQIEHTRRVHKKKSVIASHSMGSSVMLYFMKWVESPLGGDGGPDWCENHIAGFVNIAGTLLGVPKAMAALLSGEMRDTVELNPAATAALERFFSRRERTELFRSWPGASSMLIKGGNAVWGDEFSAPDDAPGSKNTHGIFFHLNQYNNDTESTPSKQLNLTMAEALEYVRERTPSTYQRMLASNWSFGIERDANQIALNDDDPTKWSNPLEIRLPNAPSMRIYCLYGHGKQTERGYWYREGPPESDDERRAHVPTCEAIECTNTTSTSPVKLPFSRPAWIDNTVNLEAFNPEVNSGVVKGEGDGTVSLLSLGAMCAEGWKRDLYNPANIPVITHEIKHEPAAFDPRGGPTTGDHVDILGSTRLNDIIMSVVSGREDEVEEHYVSNIREYARKIRW